MQTDRWRIGLLAREANLNIFGRGSKAYALLLVAALLGTGQAIFFAIETAGFQAEVSDLNAKGRNVVALTSANPDSPVSITRTSCEALTASPGISRAGLVIDNGRADLVAVGDGIASYRASSTLFPLLRTADVVIGSGLKSSPGHVQVDGNLGTALLGAPEPDGLNANTSAIVGLTVDDLQGPVCLVVFDRFSDVTVASRAAAASVDATGGPLAANMILSLPSDPISAYLERPTRFLPLLLGLLGAIATGIAFQLRSSEFAAYRLSGSSSISVTLLVTMECAIIAGTAGAASALSSVFLQGAILDVLVSGFQALLLAGTWVIVASALALRLSTRGPIDLAKDR